MSARSLLASAVAAALVIPAVAPNANAAWPDHPVKVVVPFAAGGITDTIARIGAEVLRAKFGQPFIVENEPGATGTIAAQRVARSAPDGYTLFFSATNQISVAPYLNKINYDPIKDFKPIALFGSAPFVYTVNEKVPAKTFAELIAHIKANPGKVTIGSSGVGSLSQVAGLHLQHALGVPLVHVAYRGVGPGVQDLLAGHIEVMPLTPVEIRPQLGSGRIRALAVLDDKRSPGIPDVPIASDTVPSPPIVTWEGFLAPAETPQPIIDAMSDALVAAGKSQAVLDQFSRIGFDAFVLNSREFQAFIKADLERWGKLVKDLGLKRPD